MIFVTDTRGAATHIGPEWMTLTGQPQSEAVGWGWLECVHPDDQDTIQTFLLDAIRERTEFNVRYRICAVNGVYIWVAAGAVPSFGPPQRRFLGYLGSVHQIATSESNELRAYGTVGRFIPPPPHPTTSPQMVLELVADHLLAAHGLIEADTAHEILEPLRQALARTGFAIARSQKAESRGRIH